MLEEKEGVITYQNQQLNKQLSDTINNHKDIESELKDETIVLRSQVKAMGKITNTKIEQTDDEKQQFYRELEVITQLAESLE